MIKVGILTFHRANNYGAVLQAYALVNIVRNLGYDCEIIDFFPENHSEIYDSKVHKFSERFHPLFNKKRIHKFEQFRDRMGLSNEFHSRYKDEIFKRYDICIVGSDQVWNMKMRGIVTKAYFLPDIKRKIAYAISIGESKKRDFNPVEKDIRDFQFIFTREEKSIELMNMIAGKSVAKQVLDPTMLWNYQNWHSIAGKKYMGKPFLLCYMLTDDIFEISKKIADKFNLSIFVISYYKKYYGKNVVSCESAGPTDFLNLIANASLVCTSSFHGLAFSINFNKPFYLVCNKKNLNDVRKNDLLNKFDIKNRILMESDTLEKIKDYRMNFIEIRKKINLERRRSLLMLKEALENCSEK